MKSGNIITAVIIVAAFAVILTVARGELASSRDVPVEVTTEETLYTLPEETETAAAAATSADTTAPPSAGKNLSQSGSILPEKSDIISLRIEWSATQTDSDSRALIRLRVLLDCYDINLDPRTCTLTVYESPFEFMSPRCLSRENKKISLEIYSGSYMVESPAGEDTVVPVAVSMPFNGSYGSKYFDELTVSGTITLTDMGDGSQLYKPETPASPFGT